MKKADFEFALVEYKSILERIAIKAKTIHDVLANHWYIELDLPYSVHLNRVAEVFTRFGYLSVNDKEHIIPCFFAAYFHDAIEDARQTYNDIQTIALEIGLTQQQATLAADIVYALTDEKGKNRQERENSAYFEGIHRTPYAAMLKCCDRIANISFAWENHSEKKFKMYRDEMDYFIQNITTFQTPEMITEETAVPDEMICLLDKLKQLPQPNESK